MISKSEYIKSKRIVEEYEAQQKSISSDIKKSKLKKGMIVGTKKGCRLRGRFTGTVVGFGVWGEYPAVKVKKDINGRIVLCLLKNIIKL